MSRVLLVAYGFPPRAASGVRRAQKLAKYLPGQGWEVTVLTVQDPPAAALDASALAELPEQVRVVRAWSLEPTRLVQAIRRGVRGGAKRTSAGEGSSPRTESEAPSRPVAVASASYSGRSPAFVGAVRFFFLPDEKRGWLRYAVRAALSDTREAPVDAVVSTGPPFTGYLVGDRVAAALDVPHVLDFRD
ncbi:MAG: hypothetical protein IBX63_05270, partial [Coriobacteriia bacterium]|nr:hypothetical protein [Coriobacteriia bacterium]